MLQRYWEVAEFDQLLAKIREIIPDDQEKEHNHKNATETKYIKQAEIIDNSKQDSNKKEQHIESTKETKDVRQAEIVENSTQESSDKASKGNGERDVPEASVYHEPPNTDNQLSKKSVAKPPAKKKSSFCSII